jgi:orotate phosphoribosyltransferase
MHFMVRMIWGAEHAEAPLDLASGPSSQARSYDPLRFTAGDFPEGSHVILVDDSWTTGGNVQSAAAALKRAGAAQVSVMVLARILDDRWEPTRRFIEDGGLRRPFDPSMSPWQGV